MFMKRCFTNCLIKRCMATNADIVQACTAITNHNRRSLERLRIARKPMGYILDVQTMSYWNKLVIKRSNRYVEAAIHHFENGPIVEASTKEWALRRHLYSSFDSAAYKLLGQVLAQRCLECGICEVYYPETGNDALKSKILIKELTDGGVYLQEPKRYVHPNDTAPFRPEKPWETFE